MSCKPQPGEIYTAPVRAGVCNLVWTRHPVEPPSAVEALIVSRHVGCGRKYVTYEVLGGFRDVTARPATVSGGRAVVTVRLKHFRRFGWTFDRDVELTLPPVDACDWARRDREARNR